MRDGCQSSIRAMRKRTHRNDSIPNLPNLSKSPSKGEGLRITEGSLGS